MNNIDVVYTPWANLKKTASMDVGQVGFHNPKMVSCFILCFVGVYISVTFLSFEIWVLCWARVCLSNFDAFRRFGQ